MTLRQFAAFAQVAKQRNISKAAHTLRVSQPSLSNHLRKLARSYNIILFTRTASGIRLTDEGFEFLKKIEPILSQMEEINNYYRNDSTKDLHGRLIVGGTYGPSSRILPSLLGVFKKNFPQVEITLLSNSNAAIHKLISDGELDVAVTSRPPTSIFLSSEPFVAAKRVAFAAQGHPVTKKNPLSLKDLEKVPLIIRGGEHPESSMGLILNALREKGYKLNIAMRCESPEAIKLAVQQKLGIGIMYHDAVKTAIARGTFKIIRIEGLNLEIENFIVYHRHHSLSRNSEQFLKMLREWRDGQPATSARDLS